MPHILTTIACLALVAPSCVSQRQTFRRKQDDLNYRIHVKCRDRECQDLKANDDELWPFLQESCERSETRAGYFGADYTGKAPDPGCWHFDRAIARQCLEELREVLGRVDSLPVGPTGCEYAAPSCPLVFSITPHCMMQR